MRRLQSWKLDKRKASSPLGPLPLALSAYFMLSAGALAQDLVLSSAPPYFVPSVEPNLIVSVEYSGTMHSGRLPWDLNTDEYFRVTPMATASEVNTLYYDPQINYLPAVDADGNQKDHGVFGAALRSVFIEGADSCLLDLSQNYEAVLIEEPPVCEEGGQFINLWNSVYAHNTRNDEYDAGTSPNEWPRRCLYGTGGCEAYYNVFQPAADASCTKTDLSNFDVTALTGQWEAIEAETDPDARAALETAYEAELAEWTPCFQTYYVGLDIGSGKPGELTTEALEQRRADLQEEDEDNLSSEALAKRNFANWYVYHRTVGRGAKTALSRAMDGLGSNVRVTYQSVSEAHQPNTSDLDAKLMAFSGTGREEFYDWLFALNPDSMADALHVSATLEAGAFAGTELAYRTDPDAPLDAVDNPSLSCRNNLHLLLAASPWVERIETDGSADASCSSVVTPPDWLVNNDATAVSLPNSTYAGAPYGDDNTGMLADIAYYYWSTDLLPSLVNDVPMLITDATGVSDDDIYWNPVNDPAEWQHLTTFTVGMDLRGSVAFDRDAFFDEGGYAAGSSIGTDGFPGSVNAIGQCSAEWDPWYPELNLDDIWHAGVNGRGGYVNAANASDLLTALTAVTDQVANAAGSSSTSSEAFSTGVLFSGDMVYQTVMSPLDWSGDLRIIEISHGLGEDPCPLKELGELCQDVAAGQAPYRSAAEELADQVLRGPRKILTRSDTQEFAFSRDNWDKFSDEQQAALMSGGEATEEDAKDRIDYLRGDITINASILATFRNRTSLIGDILGSTPPVVVGEPYRHYGNIGNPTQNEHWVTFVDTYTNDPDDPDDTGRTEVVYVGANDGMLHAFDANLGTELFAYVPRMVFDGLADLTMSGYGSDPAHRNFVDGPMVEGDAYFDSAWHTVLAVSVGLGAQGLFALDVTNPIGVVEQTVDLDSLLDDSLSLWELTDAEDPDIGYVIGRPSIVRVCVGTTDCDTDSVGNSQWVVVSGNGYNSTQDDGHRSSLCEPYLVGNVNAQCGEAVLFVMGIEDGSAVARYETDKGQADDPLKGENAIGRANGLAQPTVVDYDGDLVADAAYAGDLFGNLWRFDLTDTSSTPTRLFTATDGSNVAQPITTPPAVLRHPLGIGVLVIFGTGKLLEGADISDTQVQTVYAIWDDIDRQGMHYCSNPPATLTKSELLQQHLIVSDFRVGTVSNARVVSNNSIDWEINPENQNCDGHWGWYLNLVPTTVSGDEVTPTIDSSAVKERIIGAPEIDFNRLIFATLTPSADRCTGGGSSWVNMIDARNGSRLDAATFDLDLDGSIGTSDLLDVPPAGADPAPASSMQLVTAGSMARGIYTSPASLALEAGKEIKGLTTGEGSPTADETFKKWRVWRKIK